MAEVTSRNSSLPDRNFGWRLRTAFLFDHSRVPSNYGETFIWSLACSVIGVERLIANLDRPIRLKPFTSHSER